MTTHCVLGLQVERESHKIAKLCAVVGSGINRCLAEIISVGIIDSVFYLKYALICIIL